MEGQAINHVHYAGNCALSALKSLRDLTEWLDKATDSLPEDYKGSIYSMRQHAISVADVVRDIESSLNDIGTALRKL